MKHIASSARCAAPILITVLLTMFAGPPPAAGQGGKLRIAVLDFENTSAWTYWGPQLGAAAATQVASELVRSGEFSVIERSVLEAVLEEQSLGQSGAVDAATAARLGKLLGVQALLTGAVTQFSVQTHGGGLGPVSVSYTEATSVIDARLIDVNTGEILLVAEGSGTKRMGGAAVESVNYQQQFDQGVAQEALRPAVEMTVEQLTVDTGALASLGPPPMAPGAVVGMREDDVYIDRGGAHGVLEGQQYEVLRIVDEIRNTDGEILDVITEGVGVIEVVRVLDNSSICRIVEGEALEGDEIRPRE